MSCVSILAHIDSMGLTTTYICMFNHLYPWCCFWLISGPQRLKSKNYVPTDSRIKCIFFRGSITTHPIAILAVRYINTINMFCSMWTDLSLRFLVHKLSFCYGGCSFLQHLSIYNWLILHIRGLLILSNILNKAEKFSFILRAGKIYLEWKE